jgi:hypothetical protein
VRLQILFFTGSKKRRIASTTKIKGLTQITLFRCYYGEYEEEPTK